MSDFESSLVTGTKKKKRSKDKEPEDTTDYVAMETESWKRTQGPLKVDDHP